MKGVHFGSYYNHENDVVFIMAKELEKLCDMTLIDTEIYSSKKREWCREEDKILWLKHDRVMEIVRVEEPDFIIVNSGGMSLLPSTISSLKEKGIVVICISLSDPDVFSKNGRIYSKYYDIYYTNSKYAQDNLYSPPINVKLLPFGASPRFHYPMDVKKKYDVVVVGHANTKRKEVIQHIKKEGFKVGLYGRGWRRFHNPVYGTNQVKAINSGKVYLSFSETEAGYINVKVGLFEAIACKSCVFTERFDEMKLYFEDGKEIVGYESITELITLLHRYLGNNKLRQKIIDNSYKMFLRKHTWERRLRRVLNDIQKCRLG